MRIKRPNQSIMTMEGLKEQEMEPILRAVNIVGHTARCVIEANIVVSVVQAIRSGMKE